MDCFLLSNDSPNDKTKTNKQQKPPYTSTFKIYFKLRDNSKSASTM